MSLPKLEHPRYKHHLVGCDKDVYYRGFTVREQKILLHAKEADDQEQMFEAIKQVIELCTYGEINIENLAFFDIEDLFIRIRAKSVSDKVDLTYRVRDKEGKPTKDTIDVQIDLNQVKVTIPDNHDKKIMLSPSIGIMMKYPHFNVMQNAKNEYELIKHSIDYVFDSDEIYYFKDIPDEEADEWVRDLDIKQLELIKTFFDTMPRLRHEQDVTLPDGEVKKLRFEGLSDFFI